MVVYESFDARFCLIGCSDAVLSHWLLGREYYLLFTSELAHQRAQKALFTCVVYTNASHSIGQSFWLGGYEPVNTRG